MKKIFMMVMFMALTAGAARAQDVDVPALEVFGGYSLLKLGVGESDLRNLQGELTMPGASWDISDAPSLLAQGANGSVAYNLSERFGLVVDARYNQGDLLKGSLTFMSPETQTQVTTPFKVGVKNIAVLVGPRLSFRRERGTAFAHVLAGLDYWRLKGDFMAAGQNMGPTEHNFGMSGVIGGGLDINVNERVAVRVIQADYYLTRHTDMGRMMNNLNLSFGVVFRIGEKFY